MWRERHDRRLSRFEGLPARQAFDLGRALPGLPRETAQSQREDIGAGSDLQGAQAFLPRSPPRAHRGRVRRSHGSAWMGRSEEHTSELQSLMSISYAVFCLKTKNKNTIREIPQISIPNTKTKVTDHKTHYRTHTHT